MKCNHCIVHGFRFGYWEWVMLRKLIKANVNLYLIVHDPGSLIGKSNQGKWRRKIFNVCKALVVHNKYSYEQLSTELNAEELKKLAIIPHGNFISSAVHTTNLSAFRNEHQLDPGKKQLLFFGQIKETKGLDLLLEAFALTDPSVELIIAGRMRKHSFKIYEELIEKHNLKKRKRLLIDYISPDMRNILFQVADAVVLPYRKVYQSGVMLMAMSYRKATIASNLPPNKEIITDGKNGFLFESGNKLELANTIDRVMADDNARKQIGDAGFEFVRDTLDWKVIAQKWISHFQS